MIYRLIAPQVSLEPFLARAMGSLAQLFTGRSGEYVLAGRLLTSIEEAHPN